MENIKESIGGVIVETIEPLIAKLADFVSVVNWEKVINRSVESIVNVWNELYKFGQAVGDIASRIGDYLQPKLEALWHTLQQDVAPTLERLYHEVIEPLAPIIGTILVGALGLAIDAFNFLLGAITPVINFMLDHKTTVELLAGAFGALALSMALGAALDAITVGFATLQLVTIPSLMTSLGALSAAFVAAVPVLAVGVALTAIILKYQETMKVIDETNAHINASLGNIDQANRKLDEMANKGQTALDYAYRVQQSTGGVSTISKQTVDGRSTYLPKFASGTDYAPGGRSIVGEHGMEIVDLPRGSKVTPNNELDSLMGGSHIEYNIGTITISSEADGERWLKKLTRNQEIMSKGLTPGLAL